MTVPQYSNQWTFIPLQSIPTACAGIGETSGVSVGCESHKSWLNHKNEPRKSLRLKLAPRESRDRPPFAFRCLWPIPYCELPGLQWTYDLKAAQKTSPLKVFPFYFKLKLSVDGVISIY